MISGVCVCVETLKPLIVSNNLSYRTVDVQALHCSVLLNVFLLHETVNNHLTNVSSISLPQALGNSQSTYHFHLWISHEVCSVSLVLTLTFWCALTSGLPAPELQFVSILCPWISTFWSWFGYPHLLSHLTHVHSTVTRVWGPHRSHLSPPKILP